MAIRNRKSGTARTPNQMMLRRTLFLMIVCGIVAFIVLLTKLFLLQIVQHDQYESLAVSQQVRDTVVTAPRGTIYDTNMKILAMSASVDTIYISPAEIVQYDEDPVFIASNLAEILDLDYNKILEKTRNTDSWYQVIATKVEAELSDKVREFKNTNDLKGVKIESDSKRYYPYSSLAAHVIGYVGTDNYGLSGIESAYNSYLEGASGRVVRAKNAYGTDMLFTKFEDYYDAEPGNDVVLTIDATIQYYLEKYLEQAVEDYDVQNGAAGIIMRVDTGEILGMASLGNFDLNNFQMVSEETQEKLSAIEDEDEYATALANAQQLQWRNKALCDTYEPGSTFKIITLAMALEEGVISTDEDFYCGGALEVRGRTDPVNCWKTAGHGSQTLTQAVQHSCNVAFVSIGLRVGAETFYDYCDAFGFFDTTGVDLGGESNSIWWSDEVFCDPDNLSQLAAASFGQTFNITPLQLITAVSACANGGYLMQPYLVSSVLDSDGNVVKSNEPTVVRQVISEETSAQVCQILEQVVCDSVDGTGKNAYVAGYRIGGKTGTSTDTITEAQTGVKEYTVSFIGIAPADDPEIAILVLLDNPSSSSGVYISGGNMAAPTVGNILSEVLPYLGVEAQYTEEELSYMDRTVPNLVGMTQEEANAALEAEGFTARLIGGGETVTQQLPTAGSVVAANSQLLLYCDAEPDAATETVPNLTGLSYSVARQQLAYYGLYISTSGGAISDSSSVVVSTQSLAAGTQAEHGTIIRVTLVDTSMQGRY